MIKEKLAEIVARAFESACAEGKMGELKECPVPIQFPHLALRVHALKARWGN